MLAIGMAGETLVFEALSNLIGRARPPTQIWIILKIPGFPKRAYHGRSYIFLAFWHTCWRPKCALPLGRFSWLDLRS